ncbi:DUF2779 domain-containing protein [Dehalococcoides mccartyi]|uniref:DUF2779 domain-containing protein n=1 Tax=Dehalococcoides mccartyi TaxID=61435 RepID=UPI000870C5FA|nr:DUF2779 domain-containing protein [Dehalococcoides mccartyi]AOV98895.1 hypothetical protein DCWBC2_0222 [Dehalococcoides mccartyi]
MKPRYLTKSRFKLALECPTKLYYDGKPEYPDRNDEDSFLQSLAEGGFQVGELAKCYFPGGHDINTLDYDEALKRTSELLKKDKVVIYEAAIRFNQFFVRIDILVKNQENFELIEVKAKSSDSDSEDEFISRKGTILSEWHPYLADVAFQKHVLMKAFPGYNVNAYLMMADKTTLCPTDGLNQKFKIIKDADGRKSVSVSQALSQEDLSIKILNKVNIDSCSNLVYQEQFGSETQPFNFTDYLDYLTDHYVKDQKIVSQPSAACAGCQFKTTEEEAEDGLKSGFKECWRETLHWTDDDCEELTVLDLWNYRKKDRCFAEGRIKIEDLTEDDIVVKKDTKPGLSPTQRQWLQVQKVQDHDHSEYIDVAGLKYEMAKWVYPLHFIDFETSMVAIPFNKGRHPYEGIAFQFSHHLVHQDGCIEHHGEYLNTTPGFFPNYEFVRSLKSELESDQGSIFRYATHENTFLNFIYQQLNSDQNDIPDREELCRFIRSITKSSSKSEEQWEGERSMIDLLELVKRYYYNPATNGSNSIKYVLPAVLNSSKYLQEKYSKPVYGAKGGIPSLNYQDWTWIRFENDHVLDPYKLLPKMFQDIPEKELELLSSDDELKEGGAALAAYARMQFEEMSEYERREIKSALLKYCELDTLAMVMLFEGWQDMVNQRL